MRDAIALALALAAAVCLGPRAAAGQTWQDLIVTMGTSAEAYDGNLASATVPVVDSTNSVGAAVGEMGLRGSVLLLGGGRTRITGSFDLGVRQFLATGFELRDYAPRETTGRAQLQIARSFGGLGVLRLRGEARGRHMDDRPPMPLFLQPGYERFTGALQFTSVPVDGVTFDVTVDAETADYDAPLRLSQIDLLDRDSRALEVGLTFGRGFDVRVYGSFRGADFPRQESFAEEDPFRKDRMITVGGSWSYQAGILAEVGVDAIVNRSNSRRPEYDAVSLRTRLAAPLPVWDLGVNLYAVLTGKSYVVDTEFARLVPGEEADNASVVFLDVNRPIYPGLDAALRFGFTRAETDIGDAYFRRYGMSFFLNYRPPLR
jgi:hypothetical protein